MRHPDRVVFTVARHQDGWAVEQDGVITDRAQDKEVAKAAANKRAREVQDRGQPCQVRVSGEHGFFVVA